MSTLQRNRTGGSKKKGKAALPTRFAKQQRREREDDQGLRDLVEELSQKPRPKRYLVPRTRREKRAAAKSEKQARRQTFHLKKHPKSISSSKQSSSFSKPQKSKRVSREEPEEKERKKERTKEPATKKQRVVPLTEDAAVESRDPFDKEIAYFNKKLGNKKSKSERLDGLDSILDGLSVAGRGSRKGATAAPSSSDDDDYLDSLQFDPDLGESDYS